MATVKMSSIDLNTSIQCRATINMETLSEYAERMTEGDKFPPVILFGTEKRLWIGDGWHRIMAAKQIDFREIDADLQEGGRIDALKYALKANAIHGNRRSNADKRRCIELALKDWPKLSSRAIAEMCDVSQPFVDTVRPGPTDNGYQFRRTGKDGKERPATRKIKKHEADAVHDDQGGDTEQVTPAATTVSGRRGLWMRFAKRALMELNKIPKDDAEREQAFARVQKWLDKQMAQQPVANIMEKAQAEGRRWLQRFRSVPSSTLRDLVESVLDLRERPASEQAA